MCTHIPAVNMCYSLYTWKWSGYSDNGILWHLNMITLCHLWPKSFSGISIKQKYSDKWGNNDLHAEMKMTGWNRWRVCLITCLHLLPSFILRWRKNSAVVIAAVSWHWVLPSAAEVIHLVQKWQRGWMWRSQRHARHHCGWPEQQTEGD